MMQNTIEICQYYTLKYPYICLLNKKISIYDICTYQSTFYFSFVNNLNYALYIIWIRYNVLNQFLILCMYS